MPFFLPLHPRLVHFPVALLIVGSLIGLAYVSLSAVRPQSGWRRPSLVTSTWSMILLGWLMLFPAVLSGLIDQNSAPREPAVTRLLNLHVAAGFGLIAVYGLLLYERLRTPAVLDDPSKRRRLLLLFMLGLVLVAVEGSVGGQLVYGHGVGVGG